MLEDRVDTRTRQVLRRAPEYDLAFRIAGAGLYAQLKNRPVMFIRIEQKTGKFCCLAEADRQQAGRGLVQAAGMPRLFCPEQGLHRLQRGIGSQSHRLVQQQYPGDVAASNFTPSCHNWISATGVTDK